MKHQVLYYFFRRFPFISLLLSFTTITAQTPLEKEQPLIEVLSILQQRFSCTFSYVDTDISTIETIFPPDDQTLKQSIAFLQENTPLFFTILDQKTIAISPKNEIFPFCGKLIDSKTKKPIPNAVIRYLPSETYSNVQGDFTITSNSIPEQLLISCLGYQTLTYKIQKNSTANCVTITLQAKVEKLNQIIVRDFLTKGILQLADGSLEINYTDFGILPGLIEPDVLQTLQALPGIQSVNESVTDINIRGGTNDQNLILWDGIKMYQSGHFFGLISGFNPYLTEKATLFKNGTNAQYGDGVSGVIAIKTSDSLPKNLQAGLGSNLINTDVYIDTPIGEKMALQLAARKSFSEFFETPTFNSYFDKVFQGSEVLNTTNTELNSGEQFSFFDISARGLYQASSKDYFKANFLWIENKLVFQENGMFAGVPSSRESSAAQRNVSGSLHYTRIWNPKIRSEIQFSGSNYTLEAINEDISNSQRLLQQNEVLESNLQLKNSMILSDKIKVLTGYQFIETGITDLQDVTNPLVRSTIKEVLRIHGLFLESRYTNTEKENSTTVNLGLRANYLGKFNRFLVEPRLNINQQFWNYFNLTLAGEFKSQGTSQVVDLQNDFLGIENRRWQLANENEIPILQSQQGSIGLQYKRKGWLLSAEGYLKKVNGITTQSQGFQNQFQPIPGVGNYTVGGGDFLLYKSLHNATTWLSYSYAKNQYFFEQLTPSKFPNNIDIRHTVALGATYTLNRFKFSAGLNWHSGKPTTRPILGKEIKADGSINFEAPNRSNIKDFLRLDASATYGLQLSKTTRILAGLSLWNITNNTNIFNSFYRISDDEAIEINQNALKFTPNATIRVFFD